VSWFELCVSVCNDFQLKQLEVFWRARRGVCACVNVTRNIVFLY
jgi:hypothetical protein